ncbi:SDR family NAD(P)-dependent oxidoreductase [Amnibacterium sp. CER49]|uniref:SDR family NAD(P)-dependent oxidoreductase n=1 Tax=Amnibacterium sp. CER49 TaxID=3039161 RepID=UPI00244960B4|nr:SDR family NAD(P)-dependent oxidoreductase [Amnibacterium sp. CER49]MDH2442699.1 SDR family NAD(P)-dependent oxidoreductase [Amnibacterium sp. CER49]
MGGGGRVLVTGSSRGIGAAIATALARAGCRVVVHAGRDRGAAESVRDALQGDGHAVVVGDVTDPDVCAAVVAQSIAALGGLDVLVLNAGVYEAHPIDAIDYAGWRDAWRRTLDTNLVGPANLAWLLVDHLRSRPEGAGGGRVVAVGSRGAYRGEPVTAAYAASKAGLHAMTQSLALALAPHGVLAAAVAPGFVETDMARSVLEGPDGDAVRAQSPFRRVAQPHEVADVVTWLATDAPLWVSGAVLDANGASYLR